MINIKIQNNRIAVDSYPSLSAGAVNDFEITFRFVDNGWDNLTKIAVFTAGTTAVRVALVNDTCFIPADVLEVSGDITIGVYGYEMGDNEEVALRKSPTPLEISVWNGSYNKDATDPTPEQVDICEQALATAQSVRNDADAGVFDGKDGAKGDKGDKGDTGATGPQGPQGEQGPKGEKGDDYILTAQDKQDIANIVITLIPDGNEVYY